MTGTMLKIPKMSHEEMLNRFPLEHGTYTPEELAELLSCHKKTVLRWIRAGDIPALRIGRQYRIPRDVHEVLLAQTE